MRNVESHGRRNPDAEAIHTVISLPSTTA